MNDFVRRYVEGMRVIAQNPPVAQQLTGAEPERPPEPQPKSEPPNGGEVCVDTMEYAEKLKAENTALLAKLAEAEARYKRVDLKLRRVRDWIKFSANSESGIVAEIDAAQRAPEETKR